MAMKYIPLETQGRMSPGHQCTMEENKMSKKSKYLFLFPLFGVIVGIAAIVYAAYQKTDLNFESPEMLIGGGVILIASQFWDLYDSISLHRKSNATPSEEMPADNKKIKWFHALESFQKWFPKLLVFALWSFMVCMTLVLAGFCEIYYGSSAVTSALTFEDGIAYSGLAINFILFGTSSVLLTSRVVADIVHIFKTWPNDKVSKEVPGDA